MRQTSASLSFFVVFTLINTAHAATDTLDSASADHCMMLAPAASQPITAGVGYTATPAGLRIVAQESGQEFLHFTCDRAFISGQETLEHVIFQEATLTMNADVIRTCSRQSVDSISVAAGILNVKGQLLGDRCHVGYTLTVAPEDAATIALKVSFDDPAVTRVTLRYASQPDEHFFGFGEQYTYFDLKGHKVPIKVEEHGTGGSGSSTPNGQKLGTGNAYSTYAPVPVYITSKNRGFLLTGSAYSLFDLSHDDSVSVELWQAPFTAYAWVGKSPLDLITLQTAKTGRYQPLPDWARGTILGVQGGEEKVKAIIAQARKAGNPVTGLWIQDWEGRRETSFGSRLWWRWIADEVAYPHFKAFTDDLRAQGIRVLGYINPFLADVGPLYEEAKTKGYLVKTAAGGDYRLESVGTPMYLLDLTNSATTRWLKEIIKSNMIGMGLSGWMADFGEYLPYDAKLKSGESGALYHNRYPVDWAQLNRDAVREAGRDGDIVFFSRAGFTGSNRATTLFWAGDQLVTFDEGAGLASAVTGLLSSGVSGMALNHTDIGGYTTLADAKRSRELLYRWSEMQAFAPFFRTHEGNRPGDNVQFYTDPDAQQFFSRMGQLHYALRDYFKYLEGEAAAYGYPLIRHLYLHYPTDVNTYSLRHQFMLGADLLVLPVVKAGATQVQGYFPTGRWQNLWDQSVVEGPLRLTVEAPLGSPAAYVRIGGPWSKRLQQAVARSLAPSPPADGWALERAPAAGSR